MMMNQFDVPMSDADINMTSNPAKAMLNEQLATGIENNIWGPLIGGAVSLIGAGKQASAARLLKIATTQLNSKLHNHVIQSV